MTVRVTVLGAIALALAACGPQPEAEHGDRTLFPDTLTLPESEQGRVFRSFLDAYNTGSFDTLYAFGRERVEADTADGWARSFAQYWTATYRELGPVRPFTVDTAESPPSFWVRGAVTGGWSYFRFFLSDSMPHRVIGYGLARGVRPRGAPTRPPVPDRELPDSLNAYLEELARRDFFSGSVLVLRNGETLFHRAYGTADHRHGVPADTGTRYLVASTAKPFTAVAALRLVAEGELDLGDLVETYVPEYPDPIGEAVTIWNLLTHTSGIELDNHGPYNEEVREARSVAALLAAQLRHIEHLNRGSVEGFELPGEFDYTNEGFDLLGVVVQRVSGQSWQDYLRHEVFDPTGMTRTGFHHDTAVEDLSTGSTRGEDHPRGRRRENHTLVSPFARPAGGLYSTTRDLGRFLEVIHDGDLLPDSLARRATSAQVAWDSVADSRVSYGLGFEVEEKSGLRYFGHSGSQPGVASRMRHYPELGYTTVVLSNYDNAARHVTNRIMEMISDL